MVSSDVKRWTEVRLEFHSAVCHYKLVCVSLCPCICERPCVYEYTVSVLLGVRVCVCASHSTYFLSSTGCCVTVCTLLYDFLLRVFCACAENTSASLISASSRACGLWRNKASTCFFSRCAFNLLSLKIHTHTHKHKSRTAPKILLKWRSK